MSKPPFWQNTPASRATAVRLWVLALFLLVAIVLQANFYAGELVLLPAMVLLAAGMVAYALWLLWNIWKPKKA
jgi:hypothetical protein